jgi:hypothetical protein
MSNSQKQTPFKLLKNQEHSIYSKSSKSSKSSKTSQSSLSGRIKKQKHVLPKKLITYVLRDWLKPYEHK